MNCLLSNKFRLVFQNIHADHRIHTTSVKITGFASSRSLCSYDAFVGEHQSKRIMLRMEYEHVLPTHLQRHEWNMFGSFEWGARPRWGNFFWTQFFIFLKNLHFLRKFSLLLPPPYCSIHISFISTFGFFIVCVIQTSFLHETLTIQLSMNEWEKKFHFSYAQNKQISHASSLQFSPFLLIIEMRCETEGWYRLRINTCDMFESWVCSSIKYLASSRIDFSAFWHDCDECCFLILVIFLKLNYLWLSIIYDFKRF